MHASCFTQFIFDFETFLSFFNLASDGRLLYQLKYKYFYKDLQHDLPTTTAGFSLRYFLRSFPGGESPIEQASKVPKSSRCHPYKPCHPVFARDVEYVKHVCRCERLNGQLLLSVLQTLSFHNGMCICPAEHLMRLSSAILLIWKLPFTMHGVFLVQVALLLSQIRSYVILAMWIPWYSPIPSPSLPSPSRPPSLVKYVPATTLPPFFI